MPAVQVQTKRPHSPFANSEEAPQPGPSGLGGKSEEGRGAGPAKKRRRIKSEPLNEKQNSPAILQLGNAEGKVKREENPTESEVSNADESDSDTEMMVSAYSLTISTKVVNRH